MAFTIRTGAKIKRARTAAAAAISEGQSPKPIDDNRVTARCSEQTMEFPGLVEGHDRAAAKIPDEQLIGVPSERGRCECHTPRRVDLVVSPASVGAGDEAM